MARPTGFEGPSLESLVVATGLRLFFLGASTGLGVQLLFLENANELALRNVLDLTTRGILLSVSVALGMVSALAGVAYFLASRRKAALIHLNRVARLASPLLLSAAVPNVFAWRVYENREFLFCVVATLFGLATERCFRSSLQAARELGLIAALQLELSRTRFLRTRAAPSSRVWGRAARWLRRHAAALCLAALVVSFGVYIGIHSVQQHYQLKTYSWDLGIFDNMMYNLLRGHWFKASPVLGPVGSHLQYHATFGAYLFLPIYALWQRPETLIVIQAAFAAAGAIPLYLIAKLRLGGSWLPLVFVYAYLVHAPLHSPLFYDFHFLTMSPVFVFTVIYCFEKGKTWTLVLAWLVAISLREEVSATLGTCALYYLLSGRRPRWALFGGLASAVYFIVVKFVVMPAHAQAGESFAWIFQGLIAPGDTGFAGVLRTLLTSPVFAFSQVFTAQKFEYLLRTLGPVLLLPVRRQLVWVMCLPAFVFTLLSTGYQPMIEAHFQYTSNWTPYVILGSIFCLEGWRRSHRDWVRFAAAVPALCASATLFSYNFGAIFQRHTFVGGFHQVEFELTPAHERTYRELMRLVRQIPPTASVAACEVLVPHVSSRENAYTLNRTGAGDADYLLCDVNGLSRPPVKGFMQTALASGAYAFVGRSGAFAMWRKGGDHARDAEGLRLVGRVPSTRSGPIAPNAPRGPGRGAPPAATNQRPAPKNPTTASGPIKPPLAPGSSSPPIQARPGMDAMPKALAFAPPGSMIEFTRSHETLESFDAIEPPPSSVLGTPGSDFAERERARRQERLQRLDEVAEKRAGSDRRHAYYHRELSALVSSLITPGSRVLEVGCGLGDLLAAVAPENSLGIDASPRSIELARRRYPKLQFRTVDVESDPLPAESFDVIILSDAIGLLDDIQTALERLRPLLARRGRLIVTYYNFLWEPALKAAERLGIKTKWPEQNWLSMADIESLLNLAGYEVFRRGTDVLFPLEVPLISNVTNRVAAKLPGAREASLIDYFVARPVPQAEVSPLPSVSVICPCRNEKGNIREAILRTPVMGPSTELIFVDGNSSDGTVEEIEAAMADYRGPLTLRLVPQGDGKGKGDAVRKGFAAAKNDVLMILDSDLTVPPEDLPKFYRALVRGKGDFINGVRLVYPMEGQAMRFLNQIGNKFFSVALSWVLEQPIKDSLCGTKVLYKKDYDVIADNRAFFGDFDPFGDFDLLFGAARQNLRIIDLPVRYRARTYGETKISRFRHGWLLLKMTAFGFRKLQMRL